MGADSQISWTDHSFNGWWGCTKIAHPDGSGCDHCYAETLSIRFGHRTLWGKHADRRVFGAKHWAQPIAWNADAEAAGRPAFVFTNSMADIFEDRRDLDPLRARLFAMIADTPWLVWLLLTKRPEQMKRLAPPEWADGWPANAWPGASVEHQPAANLRIPRLLTVPSPHHFLSVEPMLGRVSLSFWNGHPRLRRDGTGWESGAAPPQIDWVIIGGESGAGYRTLDLDALEFLVEQSRCDGVPVWTKQDSGLLPDKQGRIPDELFVHERPPATAP